MPIVTLIKYYIFASFNDIHAIRPLSFLSALRQGDPQEQVIDLQLAITSR